MERKCGVLLPVASLPSPYGIGCFSKEAYEFIDFLALAGQTYWQILPLGQTGYGDSPYQSFSTFAGNPYFIDPEELISLGYLSQKDVEKTPFGKNKTQIDYETLYFNRFELLRKAYNNSPYASEPKKKWADPKYDKDRKAFASFIKDNKTWLQDYALFSAVKKHFGGVCYIEWDDDIRLRKPAAMKKYQKLLADEIRFCEFQQYFFMKQYMALKAYAADKKIQIVGDIPIYVAFDSADTWSHPELFELDPKGYPTVVAGCPPDGFSATGQLWGNPIYKWDYHKQTGYKWWMERIAHTFRLYDVLRIDHFRGFDEYYAIPYGEPTAEKGEWRPGPGYALFETMKKELGNRKIIAEDLGFLTPSVLKLVKKTGYPGMKVLQFAFDSREDSDYLPHNYPNNCVVYTGTHDNETMRGWFENDQLDPADKQMSLTYMGVMPGDDISPEHIAERYIRLAFASVADTAIIPMQDYLNLGDEARINMPSTLGGGNWCWRMKKGATTKKLAKKMREMARLYHRL
ncbi:MAG: 4-alpha-glucanotransferase [Lachnospiraceae bacterium]|nr:4-alpha-glucanotransferase [Lachnospiraceae bacterium]